MRKMFELESDGSLVSFNKNVVRGFLETKVAEYRTAKKYHNFKSYRQTVQTNKLQTTNSSTSYNQ